jgi:adenylate cyclase
MAIAAPVPLSFHGFTLDPAARTLVNAAGKEISLRRSEFELLLAFANSPGRALTRDYLLEVVAGRHSEAFDRSIDVLVGRLRRKLEREPRQPRLILTVPGIGYRFVAKPYPVSLPAEENDEGAAETLPQRPVASPRVALADRHARRPSELDVAVSAVRDAASAQDANLRPAAAPRLSIVVLPFRNLSDDRYQQYFADGITENLTSDLSRLANMFVISRNTAFTYRDNPADTKQIGRELRVRYVLEGSVQRLGSKVRVSAQLIDAETDAHLWADRFDGNTGDLLALQDEITSRIANALDTELIAAEAARPIEHPDALDFILRGQAALLKPRTPDTYAEATSLYERALALDPQSVEAQTRLAGSLVGRVLSVMTDRAAADLARAEGLVGQALAASPRSAYAHVVKGNVLRVQSRWEEAIPEFETALALNRNMVRALNGLGWCKLFTGSIDEVIPLVEQAIHLSPREPSIANWFILIGTVHLLQSRTDEAIVWLEKARSAVPAQPVVHARLACAYALRGESERATAELAEARRLSRDDRHSSLARLKAVGYFGVPKTRALYEATYFAGLRKAGMPEE